MSKEDISLLKRKEKIDAFDIPFACVDLPSRGLVYEESNPLCGEKSLEILPMAAPQENILASPALVKNGTVLSVLLKSCLVNRAIDPTTLLLGDKVALLIAIRISAFGTQYRVQTSCPSCGKQFFHTFDLSKVKLNFLEVEPVQPNKNLFEVVLGEEDAPTTIRFKFLTDADDAEISETIKQKKKVAEKNGYKDDGIDTRITDELQKQIVSVNGNSDPIFVKKFIDRMSVLDSREFREYVGSISPGIEMEQEVTCAACGETDDHMIAFTSEFFWPKMVKRRRV
jgi:hypothetical protein